jgi:alpha-galactosidase
MLSRFHYCCESDWSVFPYSIRAINALSLFIPPESICYYHNHLAHAHQCADLDTHLRVTLFALPIYVGFGAQGADRSTEYFRQTRRYVDLAKGFCRPVLASGPVVHHHTPEIGLVSPAEWCVLEYGTADRSRGYAGLFRLGSRGEQREYVFRPRGVDRARGYEVTLDSEGTRYQASGDELRNQGIRVSRAQPLTSELVLYQAL